MACNPEILRDIPLFALLDDEEMAVLAGQVELRTFAARQRIYKMGDPAYMMVSGKVRVTTVDSDHQEVVVDEPACGEFFGFASMLDQTPHQTSATAMEEAVCMEVDRKFILLNLFLSMLAAIQAPVIMMSQNRQEYQGPAARRTGLRRQPPRRSGNQGSVPKDPLAER